MGTFDRSRLHNRYDYYKKVPMNIIEIEQRPAVQEASNVLAQLQSYGLNEPAIAAGWTRTLLTGGETLDIDVSYVGSVPFGDARKILATVLDDLNPSNKSMWDVEGIWNAEQAYGVSHTVDNFLLHYLNSIDSVYLAADGKLHDPTGHGFQDARTRTLRINDYDLIDRTPTASEEVNVCLENCRRLAKFGWTPTQRTVERLSVGSARWHELSTNERQYFTDKLKKKYSLEQRATVRPVYEIYNWGFVFDL